MNALPLGGAMLLTAIMASASFAQAAVEISSKATQNMTCSGGVCTPTAKEAFLNVSDLAGMLSNGDVKVTSGSIAMDIEIKATLSWVSTSRLTLNSYHSIMFDKPIEVAGTGALTITTNDGGTGGDFVFSGKSHVKFWDTNSSLIINGTSYILIDKIRMLQRRTKKHGGIFALAKSINAGGVVYNHTPIPEFGGIFEGLGNTISHLTIDSSTDSYVALFGQVGQSSIVRDIGLISADVRAPAAGTQFVGTLVGYGEQWTAITNSYATGQVLADDGAAGGLVGINVGGAVTRCRAAVVVSLIGGFGAAGGLIGESEGFEDAAVYESYATGSVSGGANSAVGGLIGDDIGGMIIDTYATGTVTGGANSPVGGLIGSNDDGDSFPVITGSYAIGAVSGGSGAVPGGLIGQDVSDAQNTNAYWDMETSGIGNPAQGAGNIANDPGIAGLTTEQFKSGLPAGYGKKVWKEKANINNGYPYLVDLPPT